MKKHLGIIVDLILLRVRVVVTTIITARQSAAFPDHPARQVDTRRCQFTSTNASNGSGNPNVFSYSACEQDYTKLIFNELCNQYRSTLLLC